MFDLDSEQDSFASILQQLGIETYTFDNSLNGHNDNVNFAVELIKQFDIDYVMGYSYGCITAYDVAKAVSVKGVMFLDPASSAKVNKKHIGNNFVLAKKDVRSALAENNTDISESVSDSYINALSDKETFTVPAYPMNAYKECDCFKPGALDKLNVHMFLTSQSTTESRNWLPESTMYYPKSSHWIMLEPERYNLANDVSQLMY
jgi:thioesterase domain-containing protein